MSNPADNQLPDADPTAIARAIVLRKLSASAKTRAELAKTLTERNVPTEVANAVLDRFAEVGLIDDQLYATTYARSRHEYKGLSARAIGYQLAAKGVEKSEIDIATAAISAEVELATAIKFAEKKFRTLTNVDATKRLDRIVSFLARKGYSSTICYQAAKSVIQVDAEHIDSAADQFD